LKGIFKRESVHLMIILVSLLFLWLFWSKIPVEIPIHFDESGSPDQFGDRAVYLYAPFFLIFLFFLFTLFISLMLPNAKRDRKLVLIFEQLRTITLALLLINQLLNYKELVTHQISIPDLIFPITGLLYVFVGTTLVRLPYVQSLETLLPWKLKESHHQIAVQGLIASLVSSVGVLFIAAEALPSRYKIFVFFILNVVLILFVFNTACKYCKLEKAVSKD